MKRQKHLLVVSQYFYPEQFRINDICKEWVKRGYKVSVLTGIPNYPTGEFFDGYGFFKKRNESYNGIDIIRIPIMPRGHGKITLFLNYVSFVISGFLWNIFTKLKADYVFIFEVSPMTQALVGVWYAAKRNIPCYLYVMDLWPENLEFMGAIKNRGLILMIEKLVMYIYNRCNKIFTSSDSFVNAITERNIDEKKVEFWPQYAEDFYKLYTIDEVCNDDIIIPQDNRFNIVFAGNIGEAQGLPILIRVGKILKKIHKYNVRFCLVGSGRYKEKLMKLVYKNELDDFFMFFDKKPPEQIPYIFAQADASFICLSKNKVFSITIPAKLQSCLACGKPIIVSADGEVQNIVRDAKCGVVADAGDAKKLAKSIIELTKKSKNELQEMGQNAIDYSVTHFKKENLLRKMDKYFER